MIKKIRLGLLFLFSAIQLSAQSDFREGYLINKKNDTIYGLIDYKGNKSNAQKCVYRKNINSDIQIFTPNQINGYRFTDSKYYVSKSIIKGDETEQFFLEYLVNGIVDVFYYRDKRENYYIGQEGSDELHELTNKEVEYVTSEGVFTRDSNGYIGILKYAFKESPSMIKEAEKIDLNHKSLINIARDYHTEVCSGKVCIVYEKELPKPKKTFGVLVGINVLSVSTSGEIPQIIDVENDNDFYFSSSVFEVKTFPSIGVYYKINMPYINERIHFQYEGTYSRVELEASSVIARPGSYTYINDVTVNINSFNNMALIKYESPKGKIRSTFQFGGFIDFLFESNNSRNLEILYSWGELRYADPTENTPFNEIDFGLSSGVGLKKIRRNGKELFLDLKYKRGFGLAKGFNTNTISVNFGFQI